MGEEWVAVKRAAHNGAFCIWGALLTCMALLLLMGNILMGGNIESRCTLGEIYCGSHVNRTTRLVSFSLSIQQWNHLWFWQASQSIPQLFLSIPLIADGLFVYLFSLLVSMAESNALKPLTTPCPQSQGPQSQGPRTARCLF
jgi:hypothetical protein